MTFLDTHKADPVQGYNSQSPLGQLPESDPFFKQPMPVRKYRGVNLGHTDSFIYQAIFHDLEALNDTHDLRCEIALTDNFLVGSPPRDFVVAESTQVTRLDPNLSDDDLVDSAHSSLYIQSCIYSDEEKKEKYRNAAQK